MSDAVPAPFAAAIVAAGQGKRLGALGERYSKPMVPVRGRPLIHWGIERLRRAGAAQMVVVAHPGNQAMLDYLSAEEPEVAIAFQPERRGIADAAALAAAALPGVPGFLCCACDSLFAIEDLSAVARLGGSGVGSAAVGVLEMGLEATRSRSAVIVAGGRVREIVEKPEHPLSPLVGLPLYWLPAELTPYLRAAVPIAGEQHVTTALAAYIAGGHPVYAHSCHDRLELTRPEDLELLESRF